MALVKIALLDTDYILKMNRIQNSNNKKLINEIINLPNYQFFCHEQVEVELSRHDAYGSSQWLQDMISEEKVYKYSDKDILDRLRSLYNNSSMIMYSHMLKSACDAYSAKYFEDNFLPLEETDYATISEGQFLEKLNSACDYIGAGNNLGELKTYVLLQLLQIQDGGRIYVFCSDDKNARAGIVSLQDVQCMSVLSSFLKLHKEFGFSACDAKPYFDSYIEFCNHYGQTMFKIQDQSTDEILKIACEQVFDDIFSGRVKELKNGNLKYI